MRRPYYIFRERKRERVCVRDQMRKRDSASKRKTKGEKKKREGNININ
jgi:hypothetical protein